MEVSNKEDDDIDDLRLTDKVAVRSGNMLDDLLEPDRVVQAEHFLETCSSEARIINNASLIVGNSRELTNNSEKKKLQSDGKDEKQEEMMVNSNEKGENSNNNNIVNEDNDVEKDDKNGEGDDEYVVEKILDRRYNRRKKRIEYLIKWAGYDSESENTWESAENCKSAPEAIREYEENLKKNTRKYLLRNRSVTKESGPNGGKELSKSLKRETSEIKKELCSEESGDDDEEVRSKRTKIDCILGVKKGNNEILAVVRFEDGHHDLISTRVLVSKCPKKLVNYYERSLKFVSS